MTAIERAAGAIANERGGRRGIPPITNILDLLPKKLRDEVMEDAKAVLDAVGFEQLLEPLKAVAENLRQEVLECFESEEDFQRRDPDGFAVREQVMAAIAKAEGRDAA